MALSWFWAADLQKLAVFYDFQFARATLCGLWAGQPSKTRGFLRFSNCPRNPLRTLGCRPSKTRGFLRFSNRSRDPLRSFAWSNRSRCGAALIFLKLRTLDRCRASGMRSRAFLARARKRGRAIGIASELLLILCDFNSPARPSAEFGLVDLRKVVVFYDFQIARATLCGVLCGRSPCGAALILMKLRDQNPLPRICTNAN